MRQAAPSAQALPGFFLHLRLLWGLRLDIGMNRAGPGKKLLAALAFLVGAFPALGLSPAFYALMHHPVISASDTWPDFVLGLLCFVTSAVWVTWPILSAGVDDHSELSRYAAFPISSFRLLLASTLASLLEPRSIVFYAPLVGASVGYLHVRPTPLAVPWLLVLFGAYALFNAALSRVGLYVVLNVLRQPRSAELIGGAFVLFLLGCSLIPPIDTTWLVELGGELSGVPDTLVTDAALALGRFPTGWFAHGLYARWWARSDAALADVVGMLEMTLIAMAVAWGLLLEFHRQSGRGGPSAGQSRSSNPFAGKGSRARMLVVRELVDLWNNPRARLLASVPFVLAILLKVLSGRALFVYVLGSTADATVMGGLAVYGAVVMASTFSQNAFAYDGHGFAVFLAAPMALGDVLKAKNLVHASAGFALALLVTLFYLLYFRAGTALDVACALTGVVAMVPVLLLVGNFLSVFFPVKFHANLKRRDKLPFLASMIGIAAASVGAAPFGLALRLQGKDGPDLSSLGLILAAAALNWVLYRALLPTALRLLEQRRELILRSVTRD